MRINIYNPGETKNAEAFYQEAAAEYKKRLARYAKVSHFIGSNCADLLVSRSNPYSTFRISRNGQLVSSEELAAMIEGKCIDGVSDISFLFSEDTIPASIVFSISTMRITPALETIMLLEQIYRSFRMIRNEPYHK